MSHVQVSNCRRRERTEVTWSRADLYQRKSQLLVVNCNVCNMFKPCPASLLATPDPRIWQYWLTWKFYQMLENFFFCCGQCLVWDLCRYRSDCFPLYMALYQIDDAIRLPMWSFRAPHQLVEKMIFTDTMYYHAQRIKGIVTRSTDTKTIHYVHAHLFLD